MAVVAPSQAVRSPRHTHDTYCEQACVPWFYKCEACFAAGRAYRRDWSGSGGYGGYDYDEDFGRWSRSR